MGTTKLQIKGGRLLREMLKSEERFVYHVGGSRSGKTWSILQFIIVWAMQRQGKIITIARKTFPSLRAGAYRDFIELLKTYEIYSKEDHNKSNSIYNLNGNVVQFISLDQSIKLRGLKHDIVFIDEVNEVDWAEANQLFMRTSEKIIMAQNPSDALHWSIAAARKPGVLYLHSTYKDNLFLPAEIVRQIESYKDTDEDLWNIYGLGLPAKNNELVYTHWNLFADEAELQIEDELGQQHPVYEDIIWGLDFGYNHPTALIKIWIDTNKKIIWCKEIIHESYLTTTDLITKMKDLGINPDEPIFCDSAEPKTIEEIRRAGFAARNSLKEVKEGIDCIKSFHFNIHSASVKLQDEVRKYKWKMQGEFKTDEPVRLFDDGLCAIRYAVWTWTTKSSRSRAYDFDIEIIDL